MGFIYIEVATNPDKKFNCEIESEGIYKINCLYGPSPIIETLDKIYKICITSDFLIVLTEDRDFRNGALHAPFIKDERRENNISIYDWKGVFLWNISEAVGDIKMSFDSVSCISKAKAEKEFGITLPDLDYVLKCIACGFVFIVDAKNKKLLYKIAGKVR